MSTSIRATVVHIPGRDARTLDNLDMSVQDATRQFDSAFQTSSMDSREEVIDGVSYPVRVASPDAFNGMDFAFFAGTEGAKGASQTLGWEAAKA